MCARSSSGNREISPLAIGASRWSASGRRRAEADDARGREVRPRHSSGEADERGRATGRGAGGAKGGGAAGGGGRAKADEAGGGEVSPRHSSGEADERGRATGRGAGGAKGGGRGERGPGRHAPDTEPGRRVPRSGPRTDSRTAEEGGAVHRAPAPCRCRSAPERLSRAEAGSGARGRRDDVAGLRRGARGTPR